MSVRGHAYGHVRRDVHRWFADTVRGQFTDVSTDAHGCLCTFSVYTSVDVFIVCHSLVFMDVHERPRIVHLCPQAAHLCPRTSMGVHQLFASVHRCPQAGVHEPSSGVYGRSWASFCTNKHLCPRTSGRGCPLVSVGLSTGVHGCLDAHELSVDVHGQPRASRRPLPVKKCPRTDVNRHPRAVHRCPWTSSGVDRRPRSVHFCPRVVDRCPRASADGHFVSTCVHGRRNVHCMKGVGVFHWFHHLYFRDFNDGSGIHFWSS